MSNKLFTAGRAKAIDPQGVETGSTGVGAALVQLVGSDPVPVTITGGLSLGDVELDVSGVEAALATLNTKDFATQTTLAALNAKDFATQTTLAAILAKIIAAPATSAKQDSIIGHVDGIEPALTTLNAKDFATQATLNAVLTKLSSDPATQTTLAAILTQLGTTGLKKIVDPLPAGTNLLGKAGIDQTTDGTTNRVVAKISQAAGENSVVLGGGIVKKAFTITPNDGTDLAANALSLTCTEDGLAYVDFVSGGNNIPIMLIAGVWNPVNVKRVRATNTTATGIVGQEI